MKKFLVIILLFIFHLNCICQNETKKWYFGMGAALDFMNVPVSNISSTTWTANYSFTSVADASGNLLFYTNGITLWNSTHSVMANGSGLAGQGGHTSVLIVKQPSSPSLYYVFTVAYQTNAPGLYYSIVDMSLASGQGSVTVKNSLVYSGALCSKIAGTRHCNGSDIWIVTKDCSPSNTPVWNGIYNFRAYQLGATGFTSTPAVSTFTYAQTAEYSNAIRIGQMKISPNGKKLACANYGWTGPYHPAVGSFEIYDFNNSTGVLSNYAPLYIGIQPGFTNASGFGVEFSPDCSKLYGGLSNNYYYSNGSIHEWDLCAAPSNSMLNATQTVVAIPSYSPINGFSGMQLAADGKIYVSPYNFTYTALSVINNPNGYGPTSGFSVNARPISPGSSGFYLPTFLGSQFFLASSVPAYSLSFISGTVGCQAVQFQSPIGIGSVVGNCPANTFTVQSLLWDFGDPVSGASNSSTLSNPGHTYTSVGVYTVSLFVDFGCGAGSHLLTQTVNISSPGFGSLAHSNSVKCFGASTGTASFQGQSGSTYTYLWTNGSATYSTANVSSLSAGSWTAIVTNTLMSCQLFSVFTIQQPSLLVAGLNTTVLCVGGSLTASAIGGVQPYTYSWSSGSSGSIAVLSQLGAGSVTVTDLNGCTASKIFSVIPGPTLAVSNQTICSGASVTLQASGATSYTWSSGSVLTPSATNVYTVIGETGPCQSQATATVFVIPPPPVAISPSFVTVCAGSTVMLNVSGAQTYTWGNNQSAPAIVYSNTVPGVYSMYVVGENSQGCKNTASMLIKVEDCATDVNELQAHTRFKLFPNPSMGEFNIESSGGIFEVYNSLAQLVMVKELSEGSHSFTLAPGVYIIIMKQQGTETLTRLVNLN